MTICAYCGQDIPDGEKCCGKCGCEQLVPENNRALKYPETVRPPATPLVDLGAVPDAFLFEEGFSRPDWSVIGRKVEELASPEDFHQAWVEVALQWLARLRDELGGCYHVSESAEFFLLCALDEGDTRRVLEFAEQALGAIRELLRDIAASGGPGKHVVLLFADDDDYYQYQAPFLREGMNVASGGVFLNTGYTHVAIPYQAGLSVRPTLVHELTHSCTVHLPLPIWLSEGVAVRMEQRMTRPGEPVLHQELADQHRNFWTDASPRDPALRRSPLRRPCGGEGGSNSRSSELEPGEVEQSALHGFNARGMSAGKSIQKFWAGTSFHEPGDSQTLSYSLAEILVHMLSENSEQFIQFLRHAHYDDGGQTAALDCLGTSLGDVVATFLGPGNWRPYRKALVECWNQK